MTQDPTTTTTTTSIGQPTKKPKLQSSLTKLKLLSKVVADSGDFNQIQKYKPQDSTTNPSLILQVASKPDFANIISASVAYGLENFYRFCGARKASKKGKKKQAEEKHPVAVYGELTVEQKVELEGLIFDHICVSFGLEILKKVPGYVSTQVDAGLAFDKQSTISRAKRIIQMYAENGISKDRILVKVATTWQGIKAADVLRKEGIRCNMTLIFNLVQAVACAQHELFLISPFVGRILDWHKKNTPTADLTGSNDPGVKSVTSIYNYFRKHNHNTIIMGASFRNISEIIELAGCDRLTISPALLKELEEATLPVIAKLTKQEAEKLDIAQIDVTEKRFRHDVNADAMASEKLAEGIRKFEEDGGKLKGLIRERLQGAKV